jgi:hypothetical protein
VAGGTSEHACFVLYAVPLAATIIYTSVGGNKVMARSFGHPNDPDSGDLFYVGFQASGGGTAMVIKIAITKR